MGEHEQRNVAVWLLAIGVLIFCMICLGGITRLTGSGLSMVQWAPITGILPPLNEEQWLAVFKLYQASPEFIKVNSSIDVAGFKAIFWLEYLHRILGRLIGIAFLLPMLYFVARYRVPSGLRWKLFGLFILGGAQGLLGWYMVKSGLVNNPHVSQYRLVAHLAFALFLYMAILWLAMGYFVRNLQQRYPIPSELNLITMALLVLVFITILAGGFVAGTHAGFAFNTFPLMNGQWVPDGYTAIKPLWKNFFENVASVQFNHRFVASFLLLLVAVLAWRAQRMLLLPVLKRWFLVALLLVVFQYSLGIATLLNHVPVFLAALHQASAILVLTVSLVVLRIQWKLRTGV